MMPEGGREVDEILKTGGIPRTLGRPDGDMEFHETALVVVERQAGHLIRAAPDFDGGPVTVLTNCEMAEGLERGHL